MLILVYRESALRSGCVYTYWEVCIVVEASRIERGPTGRDVYCLEHVFSLTESREL